MEEPTCHTCGCECSNWYCMCDDCEMKELNDWLANIMQI